MTCTNRSPTVQSAATSYNVWNDCKLAFNTAQSNKLLQIQLAGIKLIREGLYIINEWSQRHWVSYSREQ